MSSDGTTFLGCSTNVQDGDDSPIEGLENPPPALGTRLVVVNFQGDQPTRFLHLTTNRGRLQRGTSGQTSGHSAAADAFSIAAVDIATAHGGQFTGGAANPVETFSSDGPRRIFYAANGTPLTPGNFSSTGGVVRVKPDFAAADGVSTASGADFHPFKGTSAAAPHAAAIAALMLSADPTLTLAELRAALTSTALDIMAPGVDRDSGAGLIDAEAAVAAVAATAGACVRDARTACLLNGRLEIKVSWTNTSSTGEAQVMAFGGQRTENDQSVFFWFFSPANFEMGVKAVNACGLNQKLWVFVSGLTDRGWTVHARDTQTGATREYTNALAHLSSTVADTSAFSCN